MKKDLILIIYLKFLVDFVVFILFYLGGVRHICTHYTVYLTVPEALVVKTE